MAPVTIKLRRGTTQSLFTENPLLEDGEICVNLETGKFKIGDGSQLWNSLPYTPVKGDPGDQGPPGTDGSPGDGFSPKGEWS